MIGMLGGLLLMTAIFWGLRRTPPGVVDHWFRRLQLVSAAAFSLSHGANDAQKTMGIVAGVLLAGGYIHTFYVPVPVILAAHAAISLGTLAGGWRIIHTMGSKITKLQPVGGFAAETGAAIAVFTATYLGVGVSTTHAITGAIVGVGATRRLSAVRWGVAGQIVWAWVLTIPAAFLISAAAFLLLRISGRRLSTRFPRPSVLLMLRRTAVARSAEAGRQAQTSDIDSRRSSAIRSPELVEGRAVKSRQPGSVSVNFAPPTARFSARTSPPCSSTRCLTIASPSPVPPGSRARDLSTR